MTIVSSLHLSFTKWSKTDSSLCVPQYTEMKRVTKVKVKTEPGTALTIDQAFKREEVTSVTPNEKVKKEEVDLTGNDSGEDDSLLGFNFNDYKENDQYEVVINAEGDSINIRAPKITLFTQPAAGVTEHHIFFKCESPTKHYKDKTTVPMRGMYGFLFYEKQFIRNEHEILNGKINAWRLEVMKAFARIRQTGRVLQEAINEQETFVRDKVGFIQKQIAGFDYCHISILNRESVRDLLLLDQEPEHSAQLVYMFCKYSCIHVYVKPANMYKMDLVTRFDRNPKLDIVFGKNDCNVVNNRAYSKRLRVK